MRSGTGCGPDTGRLGPSAKFTRSRAGAQGGSGIACRLDFARARPLSRRTGAERRPAAFPPNFAAIALALANLRRARRANSAPPVAACPPARFGRVRARRLQRQLFPKRLRRRRRPAGERGDAGGDHRGAAGDDHSERHGGRRRRRCDRRRRRIAGARRGGRLGLRSDRRNAARRVGRECCGAGGR